MSWTTRFSEHAICDSASSAPLVSALFSTSTGAVNDPPLLNALVSSLCIKTLLLLHLLDCSSLMQSIKAHKRHPKGPNLPRCPWRKSRRGLDTAPSICEAPLRCPRCACTAVWGTLFEMHTCVSQTNSKRRDVRQVFTKNHLPGTITPHHIWTQNFHLLKDHDLRVFPEAVTYMADLVHTILHKIRSDLQRTTGGPTCRSYKNTWRP